MLSRDIDKARDAYKKQDVEASRQAHAAPGRKPLESEVHKQTEGRYIKSVIYGGLDGIITTFAVVAGVAGADLPAGVVLIMGFANLIADGLSMAIGDGLSTKAEREYNAAERQRESWEVDNYPEGEKRELVEVYMDKGLSEEDAARIVDIVAKNRQAWIDMMMVEELGIIESDESPVKNAVATFLSFSIFGFVPLLSHVLALGLPSLKPLTFLAACVLTGVTLFALGALKVRITGRNWLKSGLEMFVIGGVAAAAAYLVGYLLSGLA